jgi:tungstate transport system substrate-binding protein
VIPEFSACRTLAAGIGACLMALAAVPAPAQERPFITVASTTSTEQSGLFDHILPAFTLKTGTIVRVVALGTGQALRVGERGDADVVFVHDREAEDAFVAAGFGVERRDVMYNDFVIVGPKADSAGIAATKDAVEGLKLIAGARAPFVSRGDDSGTHRLELRLWNVAGIDPRATVTPGGWYRETGSGMGPALNTAAAMGAYLIADRGTWLNFRNRRDLIVLSEGDDRLFNPYGVMLVNPARHPHVKAAEGRRFIDWLVSNEGQAAIAGYKIGGESLFFPNAKGEVR